MSLEVVNGSLFTVLSVLYCAVLLCAVLYCFVLYCAVLFCTVLYCTNFILREGSKKYIKVWSTGGLVGPNHTIIAKHYIHLQLYSTCSCTSIKYLKHYLVEIEGLTWWSHCIP